MPISRNRDIHCRKCQAYIKTERFGDALNLEEIRKMHYSLCEKCKGSLIERLKLKIGRK